MVEGEGERGWLAHWMVVYDQGGDEEVEGGPRARGSVTVLIVDSDQMALRSGFELIRACFLSFRSFLSSCQGGSRVLFLSCELSDGPYQYIRASGLRRIIPIG